MTLLETVRNAKPVWFTDGCNGMVHVSPGARDALVELADAAHRANFDVPCGRCDKEEFCPNYRLESALARLRQP